MSDYSEEFFSVLFLFPFHSRLCNSAVKDTVILVKVILVKMDLELRHFAHYKNIYFIYIIIVCHFSISKIDFD